MFIARGLEYFSGKYLISEKGISTVDFMKIDVEGAEAQVLIGAYDLLKYRPPKIILVEICEQNLQVFDTSPKELVDMLQKFGYIPHEISDKKLLPFSGNYSRSFNLFFVHNDALDLVRKI